MAGARQIHRLRTVVGIIGDRDLGRFGACIFRRKVHVKCAMPPAAKLPVVQLFVPVTSVKSLAPEMVIPEMLWLTQLQFRYATADHAVSDSGGR